MLSSNAEARPQEAQDLELPSELSRGRVSGLGFYASE